MFLMEVGLIVGYNIAQAYGSQYGVQEEGFQAASIGGMMLTSGLGTAQGAFGAMKGVATATASLGKGVISGIAHAPASLATAAANYKTDPFTQGQKGIGKFISYQAGKLGLSPSIEAGKARAANQKVIAEREEAAHKRFTQFNQRSTVQDQR
jgi:hypothetical protein